MKNILLLFFVTLVAFVNSDIQTDRVFLDWPASDVDFEEGENYVAWLDNPGFPGNGSKLPVYTRLCNNRYEQQNVKILVDGYTFEKIEMDLSPEILASIPDEIVPEIQILKSGSSVKHQIKLIAIKKEGGTLYRLKSFSLKQFPVSDSKSTSLSHSWASSSVLSSGKWVKISVPKKGIYKIPYSQLTGWGFSQPSNVKLYGSGALSLSENPGEIEYDDLVQNAVWRNTNNGEECLFFYAPGATAWQADLNGIFHHKNNDYTSTGYFFLSETGNEKQTEVLSSVPEAPTHELSSFDEYSFIENELYNILPLGSGKQWFGEKFSNGNARSYNFELYDAEAGIQASLFINAAARSYAASSFQVSGNSNNWGTLSFSSVNTNDTYGLYAYESNKRFTFNASDGALKVDVKYSASNSNAEAWMDYLELTYRRKLIAGSDALFFRDLTSVGLGNVAEFSVANAGSTTKVLNVSDPNNVKEVSRELSDNTLIFRQKSDELHEYVVFKTDGDFPKPTFVSDISNQNLHALSTPEFLIISHPNFISSAEELANFHREYDGMSVEVVNAEKVYNEFSSGSKNVTGIRNFIKMFYDRESDLKYVLLLGDGSYDNRGINTESNNFIPTYQSDNSLTPTSSFVTDDYFVMLDDGESVYNGAIDLGIGRIPASTAYEAQLVVDKVKRYYQPAALGSWRNRITFIGDDEDSGLHMKQSEELADSVNVNNNAFYTDKIYFDSYVQEVTPSGERYPDVNNAINERVKDGVLILNYVGHANERFLAHESVLTISDINSWTNANKMPIFVTATCEFSRFDADETSAGEYVLLNPNGGGIGLFSTTRVVYATANFQLSKSFYSVIFDNDENGEHYRMGDVMRLAKTRIPNSINKRNFSLLADPALKLSFPKYNVITESINSQDAGTGNPTIGALQKVRVSGYVADAFGNRIDDFSGTLIPTVYDKEVKMQTLGNGGETPVKFKVRENIIYKGKSSVTNGDFTFSFVVPKDISYSLGTGKIMYYADNGEVDAHGAFENFNIGGNSSNITDNTGPDIKLFLDSENFNSGDVTGNSPVLLANLSDENGINTVGTGIGHDITAVLDGDYSQVFVLNNYYQANTDDYTSGSITYPLSDIPVGHHTLILKAWDVANNSSEVEIDFEVTGDLMIREISNYPNPVNDYTYFVLEHNQNDANLDVIFDIYDLSGRSIDRFQTRVGSSGGVTSPIRWDLAESNIAATSGVYIIRAIIQNGDGIISTKSGKLIITR
ncbi:MAG TPA: type IX secretion system sortase PorU [Draconibacterium sp.]|nr:type IX secretion system sortase PorU [Draconibacterium sp.]